MSKSIRGGSAVDSSLTLHTLTYLAIPAFDGLPIFHHGKVVVFGPAYFYTETAMYVGVCALVLSGIALISRHRRPEVRGFAVVLLMCLGVVFVPGMGRLAGKLPVVGGTQWVRLLMPMALAVAVLAGYGVDLVVRSTGARRTAWRLGAGFAIAAAVLAGLWLFGRGALNPAESSIRAHSFIWPVVETVLGLAVAGYLLVVGRIKRAAAGHPDGLGHPDKGGPWIVRSSGAIAGAVLLAGSTAFLVSSGTTVIQSSPHSFPQTPAARGLVQSVGSSTVALDSTNCELGLNPNVNDAYGVHELEVYDPVIPADYFSAWPTDVGTPVGNRVLYSFCPVVNTAAQAREFGVGYVLASVGEPGPTGAVYVRRLGDEDLYRIPGSGEATVAPLSGGELPPARVVGDPVAVSHPSPSQWHLTTSSDVPQALRLHLTNTPGWNATIDGKPLMLQPYAGMMLQARIPAGEHTIDLHYWPRTLTEGILLASASALFLVGLLVGSSVRKRRSHRNDPAGRLGAPR